MSTCRGMIKLIISIQRVNYIAVKKNMNILCVLTTRNHVLIEVKIKSEREVYTKNS